VSPAPPAASKIEAQIVWLHELFFSGEHVANAVIVIAVVSVLGLAVGQIRMGPVQLGIAGPLFIGIALGNLGFKINVELLASRASSA
jgi:putative transport protein